MIMGREATILAVMGFYIVHRIRTGKRRNTYRKRKHLIAHGTKQRPQVVVPAPTKEKIQIVAMMDFDNGITILKNTVSFPPPSISVASISSLGSP